MKGRRRRRRRLTETHLPYYFCIDYHVIKADGRILGFYQCLIKLENEISEKTNKQTNKKKSHLIVNRKLPFHVMSLPQEVRC